MNLLKTKNIIISLFIVQFFFLFSVCRHQSTPRATIDSERGPFPFQAGSSRAVNLLKHIDSAMSRAMFPVFIRKIEVKLG